jgi:hypothetical protein
LEGIAMNRRKTGVNEVILPDGNGGSMRVITATAKRWQVVLAAITAIISIYLFVGEAARRGVNIAIEEQVEEMAADEHSGLHREIVDVAEDEAEAVAGAFQDDLDIYEKQQIEHGKAIARIETNIENLDEKIDDKTQAIIDEIRRNQGGGG